MYLYPFKVIYLLEFVYLNPLLQFFFLLFPPIFYFFSFHSLFYVFIFLCYLLFHSIFITALAIFLLSHTDLILLCTSFKTIFFCYLSHHHYNTFRHSHIYFILTLYLIREKRYHPQKYIYFNYTLVLIFFCVCFGDDDNIIII